MLDQIAAALAGAIGAEVIRYGIQRRSKRQQTIDEWYEESLSLVSHGYGLCMSAQTRSNLNYGNISTEAYEISQRLNEKANPYPKDVDSKTAELVYNLATVFRKLSAVTEATEEQPAEESVNELFEMGQREQSNMDDVDMGDVIDKSLDNSGTLNQIFENTNIDTQNFGEQFGEEYTQADSIENLIESMEELPSNNRRTVERQIESNMLSKDWDESLSIGVRIHLEIASNLCEDVINNISQKTSMDSVHQK
ncbi:hypothetical protein [Halorubrum distributum]|uniref:hypothetical protein n=1 Tax=Halorubrum distributum TaxID=29283 RepID=UPI00126775C4|nr:hypothetical protein [Halorubrum distributum]